MKITKNKAFLSALWCGLTVPYKLFCADEIRFSRVDARKISARDAMRNDWNNIGRDFRNVIAREEAAISTKQ